MSLSNLCVIIVNYGTAELIIRHIDKLRAEVGAAPIYIVDNASPNGDLTTLQRFAESDENRNQLHILDAGSNLGFAGGNNLAYETARAAQPDFVLFLNPDAYPRTGAVKALVETLQDHPDTAIAGARLENEDGSERHSYFEFPGILREFSAEAQIGAFRKSFETSNPDKSFEVDWVSGAAFLLRTTAAPQALMDDDYFLYFEETDMMLRLSQDDWKIRHIPDARIVHIAGAATGVEHGMKRPKQLPKYWFHSWRRYFTKNHGRPYAAFASIAKLLGVTVYSIKSAIQKHGYRKPERYLRDVFVHCFVATLRGK